MHFFKFSRNNHVNQVCKNLNIENLWHVTHSPWSCHLMSPKVNSITSIAQCGFKYGVLKCPPPHTSSRSVQKETIIDMSMGQSSQNIKKTIDIQACLWKNKVKHELLLEFVTFHIPYSSLNFEPKCRPYFSGIL